MAPMPNSNRLPPETARRLSALEAFLNTRPQCRDFCCIRCHNTIAYECQFIQDLYPFSMAWLLFDNVAGVMLRAGDPSIRGVYVGEYPAGGHVDLFSIYCASCGTWVGWKIMWLYEFYHPVIRPSRYILACGGAIGGVGMGIEAEFF